MLVKHGLALGVILLGVIVLVGCYIPTEKEQDTLTVGVILVDDTAAHGWGPGIEGTHYRELDIEDHRVVVFDRLNTTPDTTLLSVVTMMVERGVDVVFLPAAQLDPAELSTVYATYPDLLVIANITARSEVLAMLDTLPARVAAQNTGANTTPTPDTTDDGRASRESSSLAGLVFITVAIGGALLMAWRNASKYQGSPSRSRSKKGKSKRRRAPGIHGKALALEAANRPLMTNFTVQGDPAPVIHKLSTYVQGDPHFDESFPIELPSNEFLGECGLGIATSVSRYAPDKVAALEVWLFDKADTRTGSTILVSEHIHADGTQHAVSQDTGPTVITLNAEVVLDTATLRLRGRVIDFQYGYDDDQPAHSFVDYVVLEIAVWQKSTTHR